MCEYAMSLCVSLYVLIINILCGIDVKQVLSILRTETLSQNVVSTELI